MILSDMPRLCRNGKGLWPPGPDSGAAEWGM
jgi:hypothetical protein